jgi:hypothetical protein
MDVLREMLRAVSTEEDFNQLLKLTVIHSHP